MNASKVAVVVVVAVVIGVSIGFAIITRQPTTTNSLSCEGARTQFVIMPSASTHNHTAYQTNIYSTLVLPSTTFTTTTNSSSSIGQVVISTTSLDTPSFGRVYNWIVNTCTYVR